MKKKYLCICGILVLLLFGCAKKPPSVFRVGTNVWPGYEFLYLSRSLGYYNGTPIRLVEYPSTTEVIHAYLNGTIEAAAITMDEVLLLTEYERQPRVMLVMDFSEGGDAILGTSEIKGLLDIKGKRVGVESGALGAFVISRALEIVGMEPEDIHVIPLKANEHEDAFKNGLVDAVVTFEPVRSRLLAKGANLLFDSSQIPDEIMDVLVVREEIISGNANTIEILLKGWFKAIDYFRENREEAACKMAPRMGVSPEQFLMSLNGLHIPDLKENVDLLAGSPSITLKNSRKLAQSMLNLKLLKSIPDLSSLIYAEPVRKLTGEGGKQ